MVRRATMSTLGLIAVITTSVAACGSDTSPSDADASVSTSVVSSTTSDSAPTSTESASTTTTPSSTATPSTTSTTATSTTTTSTTTTVPVPSTIGPLDLNAEQVGLGRSVGGRPIIAERFGTPGGRRVLVIGIIHGNEDDGVAIVDDLRSKPVPDGVELWIVESMNPDGQLGQFRGNDNGVDLNRNFPHDWGPIGVPGDPQYAGTGPASEPETQAMVNFMGQLRPDITIWYHQDLFVIAPAQGREGRVRERYAQLTGLPIGGITGGTYTGVAATWARTEFRPDDGVAFIVELGPTLSPLEAVTHADAVRTIAVEG